MAGRICNDLGFGQAFSKYGRVVQQPEKRRDSASPGKYSRPDLALRPSGRQPETGIRRRETQYLPHGSAPSASTSADTNSHNYGTARTPRPTAAPAPATYYLEVLWVCQSLRRSQEGIFAG